VGADEKMTGRKWELPEDRNRLTKKQIVALFMEQDGKCCLCSQELKTKGHLPIDFIDEHINPLWRGGSNELQNRGLACKPCAGEKTSTEATARAKGKRVTERFIGVKKPKNPMPGSRNSRWKRRMDGTVEER
jgi:hypothetical protein